MAFTRNIREGMIGRSRGHCEVTGVRIGGMGEAMHTDHSKDKPGYNDIKNGRYVDRGIHWLDHVYQRDKTQEAQLHNFAKDSIWSRMSQAEKDRLDDILYTKTDREILDMLEP